MKILKPMLAGNVSELVQYPVYASTKLDGIRATVQGGVFYSRSSKPIPNKALQAFAQQHRAILEGFDGELIAGSPCDKNAFSNATSQFMSIEKPLSDWRFYVFDHLPLKQEGFDVRLENLQAVAKILPDNVLLVKQQHCTDAAAVDVMERDFLRLGYEGLIVRAIDGRYKHGRSTANEGLLLKLKRFTDAEAAVVGFERLVSENEKVAMLGALVVEDIKTGVSFNVGTGFTKSQRIEMWAAQSDYLGKLIKYKYFEVGTKDKPRHPVFIGLRSVEDL